MSQKKGASLFSTIILEFLGRFKKYCCTVGNRNEYFAIIGGGAENARPDKIQDLTLTDQIAGVENVRADNCGPNLTFVGPDNEGPNID